LRSIEATVGGTKATIIVTGIGTVVALFAAIVAVLTYGQAWFGIGVSTRDVIRATVSEMHAEAPAPSPAQPPTVH
jgi:hypothetical protein